MMRPLGALRRTLSRLLIVPSGTDKASGVDDKGWARLGRAIRLDRSQRWRTRAQFSHACGLSERVLDDLETGARDNYRDETLAAVEVALGWQPGTCQRVVQGGRVRRDLERLWRRWPRLSPKSRRALADLAESMD